MKTQTLNTIVFRVFVAILIIVAIVAIAVAITHSFNIHTFNY